MAREEILQQTLPPHLRLVERVYIDSQTGGKQIYRAVWAEVNIRGNYFGGSVRGAFNTTADYQVDPDTGDLITDIGTPLGKRLRPDEHALVRDVLGLPPISNFSRGRTGNR